MFLLCFTRNVGTTGAVLSLLHSRGPAPWSLASGMDKYISSTYIRLEPFLLSCEVNWLRCSWFPTASTTLAYEVPTPVLIATTLRDPQLSCLYISGRSHLKEISLTCGL